MTDDAGFFKNLSGLATEYVRQKRKTLQSDPQTNVDSTGGGSRYQFSGQEITFEDLRDIKDIRDSGGQVAQLMDWKSLLNFGEGAEVHVETDAEDDELPTEIIDGEELTLEEWLETEAFPKLDLTVLDLGGDALWYPCAVGEIQETVTGDFKRALPAEPWTVIPVTNSKGEVEAYRQRTKAPGGGYTEQTLPAEDLWHIVINKASARDQTGISEVLRNKDEIRAFKENEQAINQAIELHGFPQRHVKVGREEGAPVSDDDLRRVRTIFDPRTTDANTAYFTGQDVNVETLEAQNFDYSAVHEMDMRNLTTALGLPLEAGNVGADGLGSGKPAELRFALLKLAIKANQRSFSVQFVERVMRPVIRDYSPFDHTATITLDIADPLEDIGEVADVLNQIGDYVRNDKAARMLDLPEPEDEEIANSYRSPGEIEKSEAGDPVDDGPFGGMFSDKAKEAVDAELADRTLEDTPVVTFQNVGGDPFEDQDALEAFLEDLDDAADGQVYLGKVPWPEIEDAPVHDRPIRAVGITEDEANAVYADHEENVSAIGNAVEVDDIASVFMSDGDAEDFRCLGEGVTDQELAHAPEWDQPLLEMYRGVTDPESDPNRALVSFAASSTPEFVLERIREAIMSGALFSDFDEIPSDRLMDLRQEFADTLGTDNFTLDSITEGLMDFESDLSRNEAERIARTETTSVLNHAREQSYQERDLDGDERYYWTGADPSDDRQTDACGYLIAGTDADLQNPGAFSGLPRPEGTNPFEGGTPMELGDLQEHVKNAARADPEINTSPRDWVPHINCRSTFVLAPKDI